jgi:hypothetical protein
MNIYHDIESISINDISFYKPIQNKIMHYKYFYKIVYNTGIFTLNTIILDIDTINTTVYKENNVYKVSFTIDPNCLEKLKVFENSLLEQMNYVTNKKISYSFHKYVNKLIYTTTNPQVKVLLRISGVWESDSQIGLTSKLTIN